MLKATIIYLPGTAGNMLYKTLTLSEKTITGTHGQDPLEYNKKLTAQQKFSRYATWDATNWKQTERKDLLSFKQGLVDFYHYDQSTLWLIDHWHPVEFAQQYQAQNLWDNSFYEHIVFVDVDNAHREFLLKNQTAKRYNLDFDREHAQLKEFQTKFSNIALTIPFASFLSQHTYLTEIQNLNQQLNLELRMDLVVELWQLWFRESQLVWQH
jgi:hypothetical protein